MQPHTHTKHLGIAVDVETANTAIALLALVEQPEKQPKSQLRHVLDEGLKSWNEDRGNCDASFLYPGEEGK